MPSRKTDEIKIRVTPEEKSAWQHAAEAERVGLSELIRRTMNERVSATSMTVSLGAGPEVDYPEHGRARSVSPQEIATWVAWPSGADDETPLPTEDVPTSVAPASVPKRRTEECACGKPTWIYCGECGS